MGSALIICFRYPGFEPVSMIRSSYQIQTPHTVANSRRACTNIPRSTGPGLRKRETHSLLTSAGLGHVGVRFAPLDPPGLIRPLRMGICGDLRPSGRPLRRRPSITTTAGCIFPEGDQQLGARVRRWVVLATSVRPLRWTRFLKTSGSALRSGWLSQPQPGEFGSSVVRNPRIAGPWTRPCS